MYSLNAGNPFGGLPGTTADMMEFGQRRFNPIMGVMSPMNIPYASSGTETTRQLRAATNNLAVRAADTGDALGTYPIYNPNSVPADNDSALRRLITKCESVNTDNCAAFDDPEFAKDCVLAHEPGTNSKGQAHKGGFVLFQDDKESMRRQAELAKSFPNFRATVGQLPQPGTNYAQRVSYDKASCAAVKRRISCETGSTYGGPNECAVCQNGANNRYSLYDVRRTNPSLFLVGNNAYILAHANGAEISKGTLSDQPKEVRLPENIEGKNLVLTVSGPDSSSTYVAGFLRGQTVSGFNRTDLRFLVFNDSETRTKPLLGGSVTMTFSTALNNEQQTMTKILPGITKNRMVLSMVIPYTFTNTDDPVSRAYCTNTPFTTTEAGATAMGNDVCFQTANGRSTGASGAQSLACLQDLWIRGGCTVQGQDYPGTEEKAAALRALGSMNTISAAVYDKATRAILGRNPDGSKFSNNLNQEIVEWNRHSVSCTGKAIETPCDKYNVINGPVGNDCLAFLYNDESRFYNRFGSTYTSLPETSYASLKQKETFERNYPGQYMPQRCTAAGTMNPASSAANAETARSKGGVSAIQQFYDNIHKQANALEMTDAQRQQYMQQCYGINLAADTRTPQ